MTAPRYVRPRELRDIRWTDTSAYRVLSYYFVIRWNWPRAGTFIRHLLDGFSVPVETHEEPGPRTPGEPASYTLQEMGSEGSPRYRLLFGDYEMIASRDPRDVFNFLAWHVHCESTARTGDFLLVHAGAVVTPTGEGILFPGESGSGKTSLVTELVRQGFGYLSDEFGAIDPVTRKLYPCPRPLALKPGMFARYRPLRGIQDPSLPLSTVWYVRPEELRAGSTAAPCSVRFVIFPRHREGATTHLTPISAADATVEALHSVMNISLYRERALLLLAEVVGKARSFRLEGDDLDSAVQAVMELTHSRQESPSRERA
jgi:hypothetical protein